MPAEQCGKCGESFVDPGGSGGARVPCPKCGSTSRAHSLSSHVSISVTSTANLTVISYPQSLLNIASGLIAQRQFGISIVVCHMACEVAVSRAMAAAFSSSHLSHLEDAIGEFSNGYNVAHDKNRKLFDALTGNKLGELTFWPKFKESATRRNSIIHESYIANEADAVATRTVTELLVRRIGPWEDERSGTSVTHSSATAVTLSATRE